MNNKITRLSPDQVNSDEFQQTIIEWSFEIKSGQASNDTKWEVDDIINSRESDDLSEQKLSNDIDKKTNPDVIYYNPWYEYTPEEIEEIDQVMRYVNKVDNIISMWEKFSNSIDYNKFVLSYWKMTYRVKKHFEEIYHDLRVRYLVEKIDNNLKVKNNPKHSLVHYIRELIDIDPLFDYTYFYNKYEHAEESLAIVFDRLTKE